MEALISKPAQAEWDKVRKSNSFIGLSLLSIAFPAPQVLGAFHPYHCPVHQPIYGSTASGNGCYWTASFFFLAVPYFKRVKHLQVNCLTNFQNDRFRSNSAKMLSFPKFWKSIFTARLAKHLMSFNSGEAHPFSLNLASKQVWPSQMPTNLFSHNGSLFHSSEIDYR